MVIIVCKGPHTRYWITEYYDWVSDPNVNLVDMTGAELEDVVYLNGDVWFTGPKFKSSVALYRISNGKFIASTAGAGAAPMQLAVDTLSNVWVTFSGYNAIGRSALNIVYTSRLFQPNSCDTLFNCFLHYFSFFYKDNWLWFSDINAVCLFFFLFNWRRGSLPPRFRCF